MKEWEDYSVKNQALRKSGETNRQVDWIIFGIDLPFFGLTPNCYGSAYGEGWVSNRSDANAIGMDKVFSAMRYVARSGGKSGKLFITKPHEVYRFAKLEQERGILTPLSE